MEKQPLILVFNCTTRYVKAILIDKQGKLVAKSKMRYPRYLGDKTTTVEQEPAVFWEKLCHVCGMLKRANEDIWDRIIAVTLTSMRDSFIALDKEGNPVRNAIMWLDRRKASANPPFTAMQSFRLKAMGDYDIAVGIYQQTKSNWIRENEPEIWEKTDKYLLVSGYLNFLLTGEKADSAAAQIGYLPYNYKNGNWLPKTHLKSCMYQMDIEKLPHLVRVGDVIGTITAKASQETGIPQGLPLIATGSEKGCETIGTGCVRPGMANISFGSTATLQVTTQSYIEPYRFIPTNPAVLPGYFNPEAHVYKGYWMMSWFRKEFEKHQLERTDEQAQSLKKTFDDALQNIEPGSEGLLLQPFFTAGRRGFRKDDNIIGFTAHHTVAHVYRAIVEGINYSLMDGLESIEKRVGVRVSQLYISGAGGQSDGICQITADMFGRPVYRTGNEEVAAVGCAIAAFVGMGEYSCYREAIDAMVSYPDCFQPNALYCNRYSDLYYNVYKRISPKLKATYQEMMHKKMEASEQATG